MPSSQGYRIIAEECLGLARKAKTDKERDLFSQMAQTWLETAERADSFQQPRQPELSDTDLTT